MEGQSLDFRGEGDEREFWLQKYQQSLSRIDQSLNELEIKAAIEEEDDRLTRQNQFQMYNQQQPTRWVLVDQRQLLQQQQQQQQQQRLQPTQQHFFF